MRTIVALSGGKASAWVADWAVKNRENVVLYFNDTKWEHRDLYRFLDDLCNYLGEELVVDSDGRSPEELFFDNRALANNRMPFCSRVLKAERLQKWVRDGDEILFGIGPEEARRAKRLIEVYNWVSEKRGINIKLGFPLISEMIKGEDVDAWLASTGIEEPEMYKMGFSHNNCSGGCVRAGKKQWKRLYEKMPEVYAERERVENEMREFLGKDVHFMKDETLESFRGRIERGELSKYYDDEPEMTECIGVCSTET